MGSTYQNVVARMTITNLPGNPIAGSLSWDVDRNYRGPTAWWHGADVAVVRQGNGTMILSTLRSCPRYDLSKTSAAIQWPTAS